MKQTISQSDFHDAFIRMDRKENFSWEARELLFDYFEEFDPDMELDVIAICCDFCESDVETIIQDYHLKMMLKAWTQKKKQVLYVHIWKKILLLWAKLQQALFTLHFNEVAE